MNVIIVNTYSALQLLAEIDFDASGTSPALFAVHPQITMERKFISADEIHIQLIYNKILYKLRLLETLYLQVRNLIQT